jgi:hypothetical protein
MDEEAVLQYYPFEGDFGDPSDRILRDHICTARKMGPCHLCAQIIQPGERIRSLSAKFDGELRSYRWCNACCEAMAKVHGESDDDSDAEPFDALEARFALRQPRQIAEQPKDAKG